MGIERAIGPINVLAHVEIEAFAALNLVDKIESGQMAPSLVYTDLKTLDCSIFRECIDIFVGGYPCQPESAAGKRLGEEDPRHLWPHFGRAIDTIRPRVCFFENVEGHITMGLHSVLSDLEARGYETAWGIFSAEEVGAIHRRKRVFIMAHAGSLPVWIKLRGRSGKSWEDSNVTGIQSKNVSNSICDNGREIFPQGRHSQSSESISNGQARRTVPNSNSMRKQQWKKFEPKGRHWFINMGQNVANSNRQRQQDDKRGSQFTKSSGNRWPCGNSGHGRGHQGWSIEPNVGRVVDGCANRIDRLRLLGNGVVPATAELAFRTLWKELQN